MKSIKWLIESEVFNDEDDLLIDALKEMSVDHVVTKVGKTYEEYINEMKSHEFMVFHGSLQFCKLIKMKTNWIGAFCNLPQFECLYYYPRFGKHLLNSNYVMLPFGELKRRKDWLLEKVGTNNKAFIRPSSGYKTFTGKVVSGHNWDRDVDMFGFRINPEELVVVAKPKEILKEWRVVVVDHKVIAATQYKEGEETVRNGTVDQSILDYAQEIVNDVDYEPDPAWTLDICETHDKLAVLEVGSFSCAGLYACDPKPIVTHINKLVSTTLNPYL
jgi:hypothetical protein